jgi:hypothetical protein
MLYFRDILGTINYNGTEVINIFRNIDFDVLKNSNFLDDYIIQDGETPESISLNLYGDRDHAWTIMIINTIQNRFYDFPLTDKLVEKNKQDMLLMGYTLTEIQEFETDNDAKRYIKVLKPSVMQSFLFQVQDKIAGRL